MLFARGDGRGAREKDAGCRRSPGPSGCRLRSSQRAQRLDDPEKNWKFSTADVGERALWKDYMSAYEEMIEATSTPWAPWYVIPADNKWFTRLVVADVIVAALESLDLAYPKVGKEKRRELAKVRKAIARS